MRRSMYAWIDTLPPYRKVLLREQLRHSKGWRFLHECEQVGWFALPQYWDFRFLFALRERFVVYLWYLLRGTKVHVFAEFLPVGVIR